MVDAAGAGVGDDEESIPVELGGVTRFVARSEVLYVEAQGDYARLHTADRQPPDPDPADHARGGLARRRLRAHPPLAARLPGVRRRGPRRRRPVQRPGRRHRAHRQPPAHPRAARRAASGRPGRAGRRADDRAAPPGAGHQPAHRRDPAAPRHRRLRDRRADRPRRGLHALAAALPAPARACWCSVRSWCWSAGLPLVFTAVPGLVDRHGAGDAAAVGAARRSRSTPCCWASAGSTCGRRSATSGTSPRWWSGREPGGRRGGGAARRRRARCRSAPSAGGSPGPPATSSWPPAPCARPLNASAIGGEYLSAASFLGVAGLVLAFGTDMLWYPVGWTAGYLVLLRARRRPAAPVRAPTRCPTSPRSASSPGRCGGISCAAGRGDRLALPDAAVPGRRAHAARGHRRAAVGAAGWWSPSVVLVNVLSGGMRSITFVQAFQYWLKLTALLVPVVFLARGLAAATGRPRWPAARRRRRWSTAHRGAPALHDLLDHPRDLPRHDGPAARRGPLLHQPGRPRRPSYDAGGAGAARRCFYLLPPAVRRPRAASTHRTWSAAGATDTVVLELPARMVGGAGGELLSALIGAGAFAAFLSTSSGLTVVGGRRDQPGRAGPAVRRRCAPSGSPASAVAVVVPLVLTLAAAGLAVAHAVELAFAVAASTFCPLLVLGIWWRGPDRPGRGRRAGRRRWPVRGRRAGHPPRGRPARLAGGPAGAARLLTVPVAFAMMVGVSLLTRAHLPARTSAARWSGCTPPRSSRSTGAATTPSGRAGRAAGPPGPPTARRPGPTVRRSVTDAHDRPARRRSAHRRRPRLPPGRPGS